MIEHESVEVGNTLDERIIQLFREGLTPAEAVDYWAITYGGFSQSEWGDVRNVERQAVNKNVNQAKRKIDTQD